MVNDDLGGPCVGDDSVFTEQQIAGGLDIGEADEDHVDVLCEVGDGACALGTAVDHRFDLRPGTGKDRKVGIFFEEVVDHSLSHVAKADKSDCHSLNTPPGSELDPFIYLDFDLRR